MKELIVKNSYVYFFIIIATLFLTPLISAPLINNPKLPIVQPPKITSSSGNVTYNNITIINSTSPWTNDSTTIYPVDTSKRVLIGGAPDDGSSSLIVNGEISAYGAGHFQSLNGANTFDTTTSSGESAHWDATGYWGGALGGPNGAVYTYDGSGDYAYLSSGNSGVYAKAGGSNYAIRGDDASGNYYGILGNNGAGGIFGDGTSSVALADGSNAITANGISNLNGKTLIGGVYYDDGSMLQVNGEITAYKIKSPSPASESFMDLWTHSGDLYLESQRPSGTPNSIYVGTYGTDGTGVDNYMRFLAENGFQFNNNNPINVTLADSNYAITANGISNLNGRTLINGATDDTTSALQVYGGSGYAINAKGTSYFTDPGNPSNGYNSELYAQLSNYAFSGGLTYGSSFLGGHIGDRVFATLGESNDPNWNTIVTSTFSLPSPPSAMAGGFVGIANGVSSSVYLVDGTYAINAMGNSNLNGRTLINGATDDGSSALQVNGNVKQNPIYWSSMGQQVNDPLADNQIISGNLGSDNQQSARQTLWTYDLANDWWSSGYIEANNSVGNYATDILIGGNSFFSDNNFVRFSANPEAYSDIVTIGYNKINLPAGGAIVGGYDMPLMFRAPFDGGYFSDSHTDDLGYRANYGNRILLGTLTTSGNPSSTVAVGNHNVTLDITSTGSNAGTPICLDANNYICRCGACA